MRSVQIKIIKIGARPVRHARRLAFRLAEVAVLRALFQRGAEMMIDPLSGPLVYYPRPIELDRDESK